MALGILMYFFSEKKTVHYLVGIALDSMVVLLVAFLWCYMDQLSSVK
ncbi:hypothetical protein [Methylacidimicrobium tartarophylax]|uniref:Uncharacterized protein n=1 Tax=Methylacidimicrobium tartarophylax TaxID=1041768 RepID=A0A5E6MIA1_9BACT|nr:hypothetical protein [Methylacidimicrobium tartarophylax]VVM05221.1 hypothetical protein MAMT_00519 [Methylacidimicrobium tartarophylax]